jgi:peptide deformylase
MFFRKLKIATYPSDDVLREVAKPIEAIDAAIQVLASQMLAIVRKQGAIGLAAPQIGKSICMVAIDTTGVEANEGAFKGIMINPEVIKEEGKFTYLEGCLSIPRTGAWVTRSDEIKVAFTDLQGNRLERNFRGITSICVQHEIDHLRGILMIDKATDIVSKDTIYEA